MVYLVIVSLIAVVILVASIFAVVRNCRRRRAGQSPALRARVLAVMGFCLFTILTLDVVLYPGVRHLHALFLGKALHRGDGRSPAELADLPTTSWLRAPQTGLAFFLGPTGPAPHYLWAPEPGFVVAVEAGTFRSASLKRAYVLVGDPAPKWALADELAKILAEDDRKRAEAGVEGCWADINWRD